MAKYFQGHSGEESDLPLVKIGSEPKNEKERLHVLRNMHAHAQFCMSGDHTLSATVQVGTCHRIFGFSTKSIKKELICLT